FLREGVEPHAPAKSPFIETQADDDRGENGPADQEGAQREGLSGALYAGPVDSFIDAHGPIPLKARKSCLPRISLRGSGRAGARPVWSFWARERGLSLSRKGEAARVEDLGAGAASAADWPLELLYGQPEGRCLRYARRFEEERLRFGRSEDRAARAARVPAPVAGRPSAQGSPRVSHPREASADRRLPQEERPGPQSRYGECSTSHACVRRERADPGPSSGCSSSRSFARRPLRPKARRRRRAPCP